MEIVEELRGFQVKVRGPRWPVSMEMWLAAHSRVLEKGGNQ